MGIKQKRIDADHQTVGVLLIVRRQAGYPENGPDNGGRQEDSYVASKGQL